MKFDKIGNYITLSQGLAINSGSSHLVSDIKSDEFSLPLLRIADMMENSFSRYISVNVNPSVIAKEDDIIYTRTGQIGLAFRGFYGVVHNNSFIVHLNSNLITKNYLYTCLQTNFVRNQALKMAKSSVQPDLTHNMFKSIVIPIPESIDEQEKISKCYTDLSNKIENNNYINSELESFAKTIYDYWFLQFEFPNEEGKPYKSSGGKMAWNDKLKREIPEGWETKSLSEIVIENEKSKTQVGDASGVGNYPFFTSGESILKSNKHIVDGMNCYLSTGGNATLKFFDGKADYSTDTWCISANNDYKYMLYMYLKSILPMMGIKFFHGTGLKHLQKPLLLKEIVIIPSKSILNKFNNIVEASFKTISKKYGENQELASLRDFLLPMLMNGQVTFKDKEDAN